LNAAKPKSRRGQVLLVNASAEFRKGRPKNELTEEGIRKVVQCFREWKDREGLCRVVSQEQIAEADYNLSPSRFVRGAAAAQNGDIQSILDELAGLRKEQQALDATLAATFAGLGFRWEIE
jgi:type I restriction enzyme M protein